MGWDRPVSWVFLNSVFYSWVDVFFKFSHEDVSMGIWFLWHSLLSVGVVDPVEGIKLLKVKVCAKKVNYLIFILACKCKVKFVFNKYTVSKYFKNI